MNAGRRAFVVGSVVAAVLIAIALGYSIVRDPGPQPSVPPKISGTDDRALKRAIVHYIGAVEARDPAALADLVDGRAANSEAVARAVVAKYGDAAQKPTSVTVKADSDAGNVRRVAVTYSDGTVQTLDFVDDGGWHPVPSAP